MKKITDGTIDCVISPQDDENSQYTSAFMLPPLRLALLGAPRVCAGDRAVALTPPALALLGYLAVTGRVVGRAALVLLLGHATLDRAQAELDETLPGWVVEHSVGLVLDREGVRLDVAAVQAVRRDFDAGRMVPAGRLRAALRLERGALLEGLALPEAPGFGEWLSLQRAHLAQIGEQIRAALGECPAWRLCSRASVLRMDSE